MNIICYGITPVNPDYWNQDCYFPGDRVKVFDANKFRNDVDTPLSQTMREATVIKSYSNCAYEILDYFDDTENRFNYNDVYTVEVIPPYPNMVDVRFDDGTISRGHSANCVERL